MARQIRFCRVSLYFSSERIFPAIGQRHHRESLRPRERLFHHPPNEDRYKQLKVLQSKTGYSVTQIVLGYLLGQSFPVFPIVGPKSVADLEESLSASEVTLTADQVDFLTADP